jgi:hypothetical protein
MLTGGNGSTVFDDVWSFSLSGNAIRSRRAANRSARTWVTPR